MKVQRYLRGYDTDSSALRVEFPVPDARLEAVKRVIHLYDDDPDAMDVYELTPDQAEKLAAAIGRKIKGDVYAYFLQAFDESDAIDRAHEKIFVAPFQRHAT
jgi:hypothetical protein